MASPSQLEWEKEGTPRVNPTSWSSSRVLLAYWARRGGRPSPSGEWGPGTGVVSLPAARMRRPTADRRSLSRKTATSRALQGFASSRAVSAMSAARRDSCGPTSPGGLPAWLAAGGSGSSSDTTAAGRGSSGLRASASSSKRPASWVAVPWDASTSMGGGGRRVLPHAERECRERARPHRALASVLLPGPVPQQPLPPPGGPAVGGTGRMGWGARSGRLHTNPGWAPLGGGLLPGELRPQHRRGSGWPGAG